MNDSPPPPTNQLQDHPSYEILGTDLLWNPVTDINLQDFTVN